MFVNFLGSVESLARRYHHLEWLELHYPEQALVKLVTQYFELQALQMFEQHFG